MKLKILGTQINITFLFWAFITLLVSTDKSGLIIFMLLAVALHEAAHLAAMRIGGCAPKSITLSPACIQITRKIGKESKSGVCVPLSGPLTNLFLFGVCYFFNMWIQSEALMSFAVVNLIFGALNLLPAKGLDGGDILVAILSVFLSDNKCRIVLKASTLIICGALLAFGIFLYKNSGGNISLIVFAIYLLLSILIKF